MGRRKFIRIFLLIGCVLLLAPNSWAQYLGGNGSGDAYGRYPPALLATSGGTYSGAAAISTGTIMVMQDTAGTGTGITTGGGIQISIPSGIDMTWDSSITSATITGGASGKVSSTVSYANSDATLVVTVTSNFSDGDYILISGLKFKNFNTLSTAGGQLLLDIGATYGDDADNSLQWVTGGPYLGGNSSGDAYGRYPPALLATLGGTYSVGASATSTGTIMVMQDSAGSGTGITTGSGIKITIPSSLNMVWDSSITSATVTGGASGKVSSTVSYADSDASLVITVSSNFADGDVILIDGLKFKSFTSYSPSGGQLFMDIGTTYGDDVDNNPQWVTGGPFFGGNGDGHAFYSFQSQQGQMSHAADF